MKDSITTPGRPSPWELEVGPPPEHWDDWTELDPAAWPEQKEIHYRCVPTICFNCESGCGLLAFVDKADGSIKKFEGNPVHPGSRGRTCAKGPATINQVDDGERILTPMKRVGERGAGEFREATWEEALDDIGGRLRACLTEDRKNEVMYHVGRPGEDHFAMRTLAAWGCDAHNSHTNVCSAGARLGYALWFGADRPSPDYSEAKFALLLSAHLETGHYFNPHAQRIVDARSAGMRMAVVDSRLSNTASRADLWIGCWPGSEAALLLGVAHELLASGRFDAEYVKLWTNWKAALAHMQPDTDVDAGLDVESGDAFERFVQALTARYAEFTPEFVAEECRVDASIVASLADEISAADGKWTSHLWRNTAAGNRGGWQVARSLLLLHVLTGSVGRPGGLNPNSWDKFAPKPTRMPPHHDQWNELLWPREFPLAHYEMSFLLPHLVRDQNQRIDTYFTRVYNPVWTNPDGASWIELLADEQKIGCHVALTPTWNETAQWADWVLPMGLGPERHDLMSQETHAGTWIGFRQPVLREFMRLESGAEGPEAPDATLGTNPGQVWEESEFWIALSWKMDPDGSLGVRQWFESRRETEKPIAMDEYWSDIFDHSVPGLPEAAAEQELTPLEYMRRHGAFDVPYAGQARYEAEVEEGGVELLDGSRRAGFKTPSGLLELFSPTMVEWGFGDQALPGYIRSHVHWRELAEGEMTLLPTFRLPTLIHTRSANSKWLNEISHTNPLWVHPTDAERLGLENGGLTRVSTRIGHFVLRAWITEGIRPGVVACSHHLGRWRHHHSTGGTRQNSSLVELERGAGTFRLRMKRGPDGFAPNDPDSERIWWKEAGVNQNLTFPVQPDPHSGMHCWHQVVRVAPAAADDRYGDIFVDLAKSEAVYREWLEHTVPAPGPGGLRRPLWMNRPLRPVDEAYKLD